MKRCPGCKSDKPLDQFYRNRANPDGLTYRCKTCHGASRDRYMASPAGREAARRATAAWRARHPNYQSPRDPQRVRARNLLNWAVLRGDVLKPTRCELCWRDTTPQAHHRNGYADPDALNVIWLCTRCHGIAHARATQPIP